VNHGGKHGSFPCTREPDHPAGTCDAVTAGLRGYWRFQCRASSALQDEVILLLRDRGTTGFGFVPMWFCPRSMTSRLPRWSCYHSQQTIRAMISPIRAPDRARDWRPTLRPLLSHLRSPGAPMAFRFQDRRRTPAIRAGNRVRDLSHRGPEKSPALMTRSTSPYVRCLADRRRDHLA